MTTSTEFQQWEAARIVTLSRYAISSFRFSHTIGFLRESSCACRSFKIPQKDIQFSKTWFQASGILDSLDH